MADARHAADGGQALPLGSAVDQLAVRERRRVVVEDRPHRLAAGDRDRDAREIDHEALVQLDGRVSDHVDGDRLAGAAGGEVERARRALVVGPRDRRAVRRRVLHADRLAERGRQRDREGRRGGARVPLADGGVADRDIGLGSEGVRIRRAVVARRRVGHASADGRRGRVAQACRSPWPRWCRWPCTSQNRRLAGLPCR